MIYEVVYLMIKENLTIHRKMKQKDLKGVKKYLKFKHQDWLKD